jgi:hypothetical protein
MPEQESDSELISLARLVIFAKAESRSQGSIRLRLGDRNITQTPQVLEKAVKGEIAHFEEIKTNMQRIAREASKQLEAVIMGDLLSESDLEPLARAASPIRLTELGAAVNRTGLSATTARSLLRFLRRESAPLGPYELIVDTILELAQAPEQTDSYLQKLVGSKTQKGFATVQDLPTITAGWLEQRDTITIFQALRYTTSRAKEEYKQRQFDKFVQTLESVYGNFLPWLMRTASQLAPFGAEWSHVIRWVDLAESLERRVAPDTFEQSEEAVDLV